DAEGARNLAERLDAGHAEVMRGTRPWRSCGIQCPGVHPAPKEGCAPLSQFKWRTPPLDRTPGSAWYLRRVGGGCAPLFLLLSPRPTRPNHSPSEGRHRV